MKYLLSVLSTLLLITLASCKKDDVIPSNAGIGNNTFGCLVDGKLLVAKRKSMWQMVEEVSTDMYNIDGNLILRIDGTDFTQDGVPSVNLFLHFDDLQEGGTYKTQDLNEKVASAYYSFIKSKQNYDIIDYNTNSQLDGEIKITTLNKEKRIISGTFWYDGANASGELVQVRDGRFDVKY